MTQDKNAADAGSAPSERAAEAPTQKLTPAQKYDEIVRNLRTVFETAK